MIRKSSKKAGNAGRRLKRPPSVGTGYQRRVIVKFRDGIGLPYDQEADRALRSLAPEAWRALKGRDARLAIRPLIRSVPPGRIRTLAAMGERLDPEYRAPDFLAYFAVELPAGVHARDVIEDLSGVAGVQHAQFDPPGQDPQQNWNDPRLPGQGYLGPAPKGIDAEYAWLHQGGDGSGQAFIDLEQGWTLDHEDLAVPSAIPLFGQALDSSRRHGTNVLGIVCAQVNQVGGRGIAPNLQFVHVVSYSGVLNSVPDAIEAAISALPAGGVLLLEVQKNYRPTELLAADFDMIRKAVANGITVVEAAGNGGYDLDSTPDSEDRLVLNPADPAFRDSGAIIVGAATSQVPHARMSFSNFGARVDCYGWGENVDTADSTTTQPFRTDTYRPDFNGTSSAAPMVAGAALAIQGMSSVSLGRHLTAREMRDLLRAHGTPPASAAKPIGVMPDLRAIIDSGKLGAVPLAVIQHR